MRLPLLDERLLWPYKITVERGKKKEQQQQLEEEKNENISL